MLMVDERKPANKNKLEATFTNIGKHLSRPITVFLIGGGAMCYRGLKLATKDLDLIFTSLEDQETFTMALDKIGFTLRVPTDKRYQDLRADGIWADADGFWFDLFVNIVCGEIRLSPSMVERASPLQTYGNLTVQIVSNEDILLFKGITDRIDDTNDMATIILSSPPNWNIVKQECIHQSDPKPLYRRLHIKFMELKDRDIDVEIANDILELEQSS